MKTFVAAGSFTAYPDGKTRTEFKDGDTYGPFSNEFVDLLEGKGHVAGKAKDAKEGAKRPELKEPVSTVAEVAQPEDPTQPADVQN